MRADFIINLKDKLTKHKHPIVLDEEIEKMIHDIRILLVGNKELQTNQQYIGFEAIFRGYTIVDWFGSNFSTLKYHEYSKILVKLCVQYYEAC